PLLHLSLPYTLAPTLSSSTNPPPPDIYTLSLHDALPICSTNSRTVRRRRSSSSGMSKSTGRSLDLGHVDGRDPQRQPLVRDAAEDRKITRLNSSHEWISYAVFCLKKKKKNIHN